MSSARRERERSAGRDAEKTPFWVELVKQRVEIALVGPPSVEHHQHPVGCGGGGPHAVYGDR
jgi:hypothetical protein